MERLTARDEYGSAYYPHCFREPCNGTAEPDDCATCDFNYQVCDRLAELEDREERERWISVREKVPEDQEEVLVCTRSKNGCRNIDKGYWSIDHFIHRGTAEVTHWKPLPKLPGDAK